jgi:hypothetical protein
MVGRGAPSPISHGQRSVRPYPISAPEGSMLHWLAASVSIMGGRACGARDAGSCASRWRSRPQPPWRRSWRCTAARPVAWRRTFAPSHPARARAAVRPVDRATTACSVPPARHSPGSSDPGCAHDRLASDVPEGERRGRRGHRRRWLSHPAAGRAGRPRLRRGTEPARRSRRAHDLLAQLHRQLRPAGVRTGRCRRQGPAGSRLPGQGLLPARLHEGAELRQPDLRCGPHPDAAHPRWRARLRDVP